MVYNCKSYTEFDFIRESHTVKRIVNDNDLTQMSLNLHSSLFNGGSMEPKSIKQMFSIGTPSSTVADDPSKNQRIELKRSYSLYGIVSLLEGIPGIGSAIAILSCLGHLFVMHCLCKVQLKNASKNLVGDNHWNLNAAKAVHTHAVDYARHDYYLQGSMLAIFPFLKPLVRLTQAVAYAYGERPAAPPQ